jgi:predicted glycoside hydrolase/deacetylase ChbG (UPF0249 family)
MVNTAYWPEHAKWLAPFSQQKDIGLHFNLTEGKPLSSEYRKVHGEYFKPLAKVLYSACMRSLSQSAIAAELHAQIDHFQEHLGYLPDHIDGHQHIHQFPVIRAAIIQVYQQRLRDNHTYIRLINDRLSAGDFMRHVKKVIIHASGSSPMARLLNDNKIPHNQSFAGIYAFSRSKQYPIFFKRFLQQIGDRGLIMCHPGLNDPVNEEVIARARFSEYQYIAGGQFIADCKANGVVIQRFSGI